MTPEGRLRAMIWYDKLQNPPEPRSLQEAIAMRMIISQEARKRTELVMLLAASGQVKKENLDIINRDLLRLTFPFIPDVIKDQKSRFIKSVEKWVSLGPIQVTEDLKGAAEGLPGLKKVSGFLKGE